MPNAILDNKEPRIGMAEAGKLHGLHLGSVTRYITKGCTAADGSRVKLEAVRIGFKWVTSEAALNRFFERLSQLGETVREQVPSLADRRKRVSAAEREMELAGA